MECSRSEEPLEIFIGLTRFHLTDKNDILLVDCGDKVFCLCGEQAAHGLQGIRIFLILCLDQEYDTFYICLDTIETVCKVTTILRNGKRFWTISDSC